MKASTKRLAAVVSLFALVTVSGCSTLDVTASYEGDGNGTQGTASNELLTQMASDSERGGE